MTSRYLIVAAALTTGCAWSYEKAQEEAQIAACDIFVGCFEAYADVEACLADGEVDTNECEDYDAAAAKDCVDGLAAQAADCPADILSWSPPEACARVCPGTSDTAEG